LTYDYVSRVLSYVKSGSLEISYDSTPLVRIEAEKNQRMIDILSDVKEILPIRNFIFKINKIKKISSNLSEDEITLVITEKGQPLAVLGENAKPGLFSRLFTGKNLEVTRRKSKTG